MKNPLKLTLLLLALLLPATAIAHDFEVDGIYYNIINSNEAAVTYQGTSHFQYADEYSGEVTIPSTVNYNNTTYSVSTIGTAAFSGCNSLTAVHIPNSVTYIRDHAFRDCYGLTNTVFLNSVKRIGIGAFSGCSGLTNITIPNTVTSIDISAFSGCSGLTNITIPNSVTSIGSSVFTGCSSLISIKVDSENTKYDSRDNCNAIIETTSNMLIIGCKNTQIPNSVTSIGNSAFYDCSGLINITIPNSVTSFGSSAFHGCSGLTNITIPNSVTSIGHYAFYGCNGLTNITIPNSVTFIGNEVFIGCSGLSAISVVNGNPKYDSRNNCNAIIETTSNKLIVGCKNTVIPNSVTIIGEKSFFGCSGLTCISIPNSISEISNSAFKECSGLASITIGNSVIKIGENAFSGCTELTSINIPSSVTYIGEESFWGCNGLTNISVESNNYFFDSRENCNAIIETSSNTLIVGCKNTSIPNTVTGIGSNAFGGCSGLTSITIPNSVTYIGWWAFCGCSELTNIIFPNSVTYIGCESFMSCTNLSSVIIPSSVTDIDYWAFSYCPNLKIIKCLGEIPASCEDGDPFEGSIYQNAVLYVPYNSIDSYKQAEGWKSFQIIMGFYDYDFEGDGVYYKKVGDNEVVVSSGEETYSGNVVIPETVTVDGVTYVVMGIGSGAFANDSLNFLTIPVSVTSNIASDAFKGCFVPSVYIIGEGAWADGSLPASVDTLYISNNVTGVEGLQVNPSVIYSYAALPPTCDDNSFTGYDAELHVPASSLAAYFTEPYWSNFINIVSDAVEPTGLSLENDSISIMVGNQITLTATVTPDNATPQQVFWASTNDSIAKVGPINGELTALKAGECDIKATLLDKTVVCHVIVTEIAPTEVTISQEFAKLEIGSQLTLTATVLPEDATDKAITWTTTNSDVATVDSLGNVMAVGPGECFITATCRDKQAMCHVIVVEHFIYITLDEHRLSLLPNHMEWLTPTVTPVSTDLVVTSSNPSVAAARMANGKIQVVGIAEGVTIIKVNSANSYAEPDSCRVIVYTSRGDVNSDGYVNISDVTILVNYLMSDNVNSISMINADVNNDNDLNISDVTRLISHILTGTELAPKEDPVFEDIEDVSKNATIHKTLNLELL